MGSRLVLLVNGGANDKRRGRAGNGAPGARQLDWSIAAVQRCSGAAVQVQCSAMEVCMWGSAVSAPEVPTYQYSCHCGEATLPLNCESLANSSTTDSGPTLDANLLEVTANAKMGS